MRMTSRERSCGCASGGACCIAESGEVASRSRSKLVNRKTNAALEKSSLEAQRVARAVARDVVGEWLAVGSTRAVIEVVRQQRIENGCSMVPSSDLPRFVFLRGLFSGGSRRVDFAPYDLLTYRCLHARCRSFLGLPLSASLRLFPYRPWLRNCTDLERQSELTTLACHDGSCRVVLGSTLCYFSYVHRA